MCYQGRSSEFPIPVKVTEAFLARKEEWDRLIQARCAQYKIAPTKPSFHPAVVGRFYFANFTAFFEYSVWCKRYKCWLNVREASRSTENHLAFDLHLSSDKLARWDEILRKKMRLLWNSRIEALVFFV